MPCFCFGHSSYGAASLSSSDGMRIKTTVILTLIISSFFPTFGFRNLFAEDAGGDVSQRITRLIEKVDELEKKQQQTLVDQDDVLEKIKSLKIQARR